MRVRHAYPVAIEGLFDLLGRAGQERQVIARLPPERELHAQCGLRKLGAEQQRWRLAQAKFVLIRDVEQDLANAREVFVESPVCHPTFAMRTAVLRQLGGYREGPFPEDYDLVLRIHRAGLGIRKLPFVGLSWRHADGRLTFRDPRYSVDAFRELKITHLLPILGLETRPIVLWGAGRDGVSRTRHRHRLRGPGLPDRIAASHRHLAATGWPLGPYDFRNAEGPRVPGLA